MAGRGAGKPQLGRPAGGVDRSLVELGVVIGTLLVPAGGGIPQRYTGAWAGPGAATTWSKKQYKGVQALGEQHETKQWLASLTKSSWKKMQRDLAPALKGEKSLTWVAEKFTSRNTTREGMARRDYCERLRNTNSYLIRKTEIGERHRKRNS